MQITAKHVTRFRSRYSIAENGCWTWCGPATSRRYGEFYFNGGRIGAHRFSYLLHKGAIPVELVIDHLCRNTMCVNPEHLEAVTQRENILRGTSPQAVYAQRITCNNGHEYTQENTIIRENGSRRCKKCHEQYHRNYRRKNRQRINEGMKKYRIANPEKAAASREKWAANNREKLLEYYGWYNKNKRKVA